MTQTYSYTYDKLDRLLKGTLGGSRGMEELSYDKMGNIQSLKRSGTTNTLVDNLTYSYSGNRLSSIIDATGGNTQSPYQLPGTTNYGYDENGNLVSRSNTAHPGNNITSTAYNILNLPRQVVTPSGTITYTFDAAGNKLRSIGAQPGQTRDYIDGIEYSGGMLELIHTEEGRIIKSGSSYLYEYLLKDHLGNNRVGFRQGSAGTPNFSTDYYPFGLQYQARIRQSSPKNSYLYNGKELQEALTFFDYGARMYDPVIGRFITVDPLAENHYNFTPYHYVLNNPMLFIDPLGLDTLKYHWVKNGEEIQGGDVIDMGYGEYSHVLDPVTVSPEKTALEYVDDALKTVNEFNPVVNLTSGISGLVSGKDMYGRDISAGSSLLSIASVVPIAKLAKLPGIVAKSSNVLLRTSRQLQAKFKHAADFSVVGNYSKANAAKFSSAIHQHINSPAVKVIQGTYRGNPVIHYVDPNTGLNVISNSSGQFISGWKLNPAQLQNVLKHGGL